LQHRAGVTRPGLQTPDPAAVVAAVARRYRRQGTAARGSAEKAYLKSPLRFHGVTVPDVRRQAAELVRRQIPELADRPRLLSLASAFYDTDFHDLHSTAIALLERRQALLVPGDLAWLCALVRRSANWAHVDWLVTKVMGPIIARAPAAARRRTLRSWARDPDFWVRRAALLAQLDQLRAGEGDFSLFATLAAPMLTEKEFFIRKAIGWVLREVGHKRPQLAFEFLRAHRAQLSGLTLREGSRRLPPAMRAALA
jgi:3-methyladenine DNA glycosylase AlkD